MSLGLRFRSFDLPFNGEHQSPFVFGLPSDQDKEIEEFHEKIDCSEIGAVTNDIYFCEDLATNLLNSKFLSYTERKHVIRNLDKYMYLASTLYLRFVTSKIADKKIESPLFGIHTETFKKVVFASHASKIKKTMLRLGFINTDNHYIVGKKCKAFQLNEKFLKSKWYLKKGTKLKIPTVIGIKTKIHLAILQSSMKVTIDEIALNQIMELEMADKKPFCIEVNEILLNKIRSKDLNCVVDQKSGRMFTAITNLSKELRGCLRINGVPLVELDIASSQPLLLSRLYPKDSKELCKYKKLVEDGEFYEFIQKEMFDSYTRDEVKKLTYTYMFGPTNNPKCADYSKVFKEHFPEMHEILINEKRSHIGHRLVAIRMQYLEASVVLGVAAKKCIDLGIDIITIHDSFMVIPEHEESVISILTKSFQEKLDLTPKIKRKYCKS